MAVGFLRTDEIKNHLIEKLCDGWAILDGQPDLITFFEDTYYNDDNGEYFEAIMYTPPRGKRLMCSIFIGKKECLPSTFYDDTVRYIHFESVDKNIICRQVCSKEKGIPNFCEHYLNSIGQVNP